MSFFDKIKNFFKPKPPSPPEIMVGDLVYLERSGSIGMITKITIGYDFTWDSYENGDKLPMYVVEWSSNGAEGYELPLMDNDLFTDGPHMWGYPKRRIIKFRQNYLNLTEQLSSPNVDP